MTRTCFVSNSSSSSFVIVGLVLTDEVEEKLRGAYDDWRAESCLDYTVGPPREYVGRFLSGGKSTDLDVTGFVRLDKANDLADESSIQRLLEVTGLGKEDLVLAYGTTEM